ncbi:peptidoglycan-binding domain-containing protein [Streptomyces phaeochromogenes]
MRIRYTAASIAAASLFSLGALATSASADDWNVGAGPRAVSVNDLDRPECDNLSVGASGWCTTALQTSLNQAGYKIAVDGMFGPATRAQVQLFQGDWGTESDGIVGPDTRFLLRVAIDRAAAKERVANHDDGYWPDLVCSPFKIFGLACEDLVSGSPAY